jgi:glutamate-1-semialdehyde 2,1-aminomutase
MATLQEALALCRTEFAEKNPGSLAYEAKASAFLPGANTRSVLYHAPFPLLLDHGSDARVWDVDGHEYIDCVGEFSAGLYGHSNPIIARAVRRALKRGTALGGQTDAELQLAEALCDRFPSIELIRFCNSGTEANLFAITTALARTARETVLAFGGAYHGGLISFPVEGNPLNVPFRVELAIFNDIADTKAKVAACGNDLGAIIVEPILGAGGNIPASADFLATLRETSSTVGAILIFDEVKTARSGAGGVQALRGVAPDMTTLGKFIGGGLPLAAFGGRADIMEVFDPRRQGSSRHAGTFNNNVCSLAAGHAGLTKVFTKQVAERFLERGEGLRERLSQISDECGVPIVFSGLGSIFTMHFLEEAPANPADITERSKALSSLFHIWAINNGLLVASRGDFFLSLPFFDLPEDIIHALVSRFCLEHRYLLTSSH